MTDKVTNTCKGRNVLARDKRAALKARRQQLKTRIKVTPKDLQYPLLAKDAELGKELEELKEYEDDHSFGRAGCGYDLSAQIEAAPVDGDVYHYCCPKCGNTGTFRPMPVDQVEEHDAGESDSAA
jgi:hypothetical protein